MKECENVVRECKTVAEEELWSGWNQVEKQIQRNNQGDWKMPIRGIEREEWLGPSRLYEPQRRPSRWRKRSSSLQSSEPKQPVRTCGLARR